MRKINRLFIVVVILSLLSSCNVTSENPSLVLYQKYLTASKNINSLDSFSRDENVHIDLNSFGEGLNFNIGTELKRENTDNSDICSISFKPGDKAQAINLYYNDGYLYIENYDNKSVLNTPNLINDISNISIVNKMKKSDLISATSTQQDGFEQITFIFDGKDTSIYINRLTDIGIKDLNVLEITPSDVTMVANINDDGYLTDQKITFNTKISLTYKENTYDATINYDATIKNYEFNNTHVDKQNDFDEYTSISVKHLKELLNVLVK